MEELRKDNYRLIVLSEISHARHNAIWHLFSGVPTDIEFGARQYQGHTGEISTLLNQLFEFYQVEGVDMPYTMEDYRKDFVRENLGLLSADEILKNFSIDKRLKGVSFEEIQQYLEKRSKEK